MADIKTVSEEIQKEIQKEIRHRFGSTILSLEVAFDELTLEVAPNNLLETCQALRDENAFKFEQLMDLCGIDYLDYGVSEWSTTQSTSEGFSRGVIEELSLEHPEDQKLEQASTWTKPRFAVIYHLLSLTHNRRIRLRCFPTGDPLIIPSVISIWNSANWYEREAFDLFGILFDGHPDLRRILSDYGFIGYPFRKDFPLIGTLEMRYSANQQRVIYEPVSIPPRTLTPKVIRDDNRYLGDRTTSEKESNA